MARSYHGAASSIRSENYATTLLWTSIPVILPWALTRNKASLPRQIFCARWLHILSVKALPRRVSWRITTLRSSAAFSTVRVTSKSALKLGPSVGIQYKHVRPYTPWCNWEGKEQQFSFHESTSLGGVQGGILFFLCSICLTSLLRSIENFHSH